MAENTKNTIFGFTFGIGRYFLPMVRFFTDPSAIGRRWKIHLRSDTRTFDSLLLALLLFTEFLSSFPLLLLTDGSKKSIENLYHLLWWFFLKHPNPIFCNFARDWFMIKKAHYLQSTFLIAWKSRNCLNQAFTLQAIILYCSYSLLLP